MHPAKVLVLESESARPLADSLVQILGSGQKPATDVVRVPLEPPVSPAGLGRLISSNAARAAFIVLGSPDDFPTTDLGLETPVFAATEGGRAHNDARSQFMVESQIELQDGNLLRKKLDTI